jgi:hypothetical protein
MKKKSTFFTQFIPMGLLGYLWLKGRINWLPGWGCPLRHATGIPCPTCFLTRSVSASLNGHISESLGMHIFGPPLSIALVWWVFVSLRSQSIYPAGFRAIHVGILCVLLVAYWLFRVVAHYILGVTTFPQS